MSALPQRKLTQEDYLAIERKAEFKSEYYKGEMFAMAGATRAHVVICDNLTTIFHIRMRGRPCQSFSSEMRVKAEEAGLYTYPDISVACEDINFEDEELDILTNPVVLIEILSKSTEGYDRGKKFELYRKLKSLREYVMIAQDRPHVEVFKRNDGDQWTLSETDDLTGSIELKSIECTLSLADIYEKVFEQSEST